MAVVDDDELSVELLFVSISPIVSVVELVLLFALEESDPLQEMKTKRLRIIIATKEIFISKFIKKIFS